MLQYALGAALGIASISPRPAAAADKTLCDEACIAALDKAEVVTTASGLKYKDIVVGSGPSPPVGYQVVVNYIAMTPEGRVFDSSLDRGTPYDIRIGAGSVRGMVWDIAYALLTYLCVLPSFHPHVCTIVVPSTCMYHRRSIHRSIHRSTCFHPPCFQVIPGLDEGLQTMKVGGVRRLYIPGELAFPKGLPSAAGRPRVPPSSPVMFDVQLLYIPGLDD